MGFRVIRGWFFRSKEPAANDAKAHLRNLPNLRHPRLRRRLYLLSIAAAGRHFVLGHISIVIGIHPIKRFRRSLPFVP
jgi:hypothetical protein